MSTNPHESAYVDEPERFEDFDAFWAQQSTGRASTRVRGVDILCPTDVPLALQLKYAKTDLDDLDAMKEMLDAVMDSPGIVDRLSEAGTGLREFAVITAWVYGNATGKPTTFAEALADVVKAEAAEAGKAPANRAERRAKKPKGSRR